MQRLDQIKQNKSSQTCLQKSSMLKKAISKQKERMILQWSKLDVNVSSQDIINNYELYVWVSKNPVNILLNALFIKVGKEAWVYWLQRYPCKTKCQKSIDLCTQYLKRNNITNEEYKILTNFHICWWQRDTLRHIHTVIKK